LDLAAALRALLETIDGFISVGRFQSRENVFADYRLRIAGVIRDYGLTGRREAPLDSLLRFR